MGDENNDSKLVDETKYDDKSSTSFIDHNPQNKTLNMSNIDTLVSKSLEISRNYRKINNSTLMDLTTKNNTISYRKNSINQDINQVQSESLDDDNEYDDDDGDDDIDDDDDDNNDNNNGDEIELDEDLDAEDLNDTDLHKKK
jgi:hypothetical protein